MSQLDFIGREGGVAPEHTWGTAPPRDCKDTPLWGFAVAALQEDPTPSVRELYERAKAVDPRVCFLTLRQFHARVALGARREVERRGR